MRIFERGYISLLEGKDYFIGSSNYQEFFTLHYVLV